MNRQKLKGLRDYYQGNSDWASDRTVDLQIVYRNLNDIIDAILEQPEEER